MSHNGPSETAYRPTLLDVAKLLGSTEGVGPNPETVTLVHWLVDRIPELRDLWASVNQVNHQGVTVLDLVRLHHCLVDEVDSREAYGTAGWLLCQVPETEALYRQLEQLGQDTGQVLQYASFAIEALRRNQEVDQLLADKTWSSATDKLDVDGSLGVDYPALLNVVEARLTRQEGDVERLLEVRDALRSESKRRQADDPTAQGVQQLREAVYNIVTEIVARTSLPADKTEIEA